MRRQLLPALKVTIALLVLCCVIYPTVVWAVGLVAFKHQADGSFVSSKGRIVGSSLIGQNFADKKGNALPQYFQPRPSAAGTNGYDSTSSSASNLGPSDARLIGFVPGVNTVGLGGKASSMNPFATKDDPTCVPTDDKGVAVISPEAGQKLAKNPDGSYQCYSSTVPQRVIAYRQLNGLAADAPVPVDAVTASGSGLDPHISIANAMDQAPRVAQARGTSVDSVVAIVRSHVTGRPLGFLGEKGVNVLELNLALDALHR